MKIVETTKYGQFKTRKGNRNVNARAVTTLITSIKENNLLPANPIIVNEQMEVIDGQHRLEAARSLRIPVYYVIFDPASLTEIQLLNTAVKRWMPQDFLNSYIIQGNKNYVILNQFYTQYKFPLRFCLVVLGKEKVDSKILYSHFHRGKFEVGDLSRATQMADQITRLTQYSASKTERNVGQGSRFFEAILRLYYKDPTLITRLEGQLARHGLKLYRMDTRRDYLRQFEDILNKGRQGKAIRLT